MDPPCIPSMKAKVIMRKFMKSSLDLESYSEVITYPFPHFPQALGIVAIHFPGWIGSVVVSRGI